MPRAALMSPRSMMFALFQPNHAQSRSLTSLGHRIIAAEKHGVVARYERRLHHDVTVHRVERLHHAHGGKIALHLFAERIGVADRQRRRHSCGHIERIGDVDENFPAQIGCAGLTQRHERVRTIGAVEEISPNAAARQTCRIAPGPTARSHACPASLVAVRDTIMMSCPILTSVVAMALPTIPVPRTAMCVIVSLS